MPPNSETQHPFSQRFRGFFPVVLDVETAGFNSQTDALLELSASILDMDDEGHISQRKLLEYHIEPFAGANLDQAALDFNGINPHDPQRQAVSEDEAITSFFQQVRKAVKQNDCTRAVVVAHNAHFDLGFLMAAAERCEMKRNPFHPFTCFDTATLAGLAYGQTVLAKACMAASISFNNKEAHSASYDTEKTAELFCTIVNQWEDSIGSAFHLPL